MPTLVVGRLEGESVVIGDDVVVRVVFAAGGKARLAITAPEHVRVDRSEVRASKDRERQKGRAT